MAAQVKLEGMPLPRPLCRFCGKPVRYIVNTTYAGGVVTRRQWALWNAYPRSDNPLFCRLKCALRFAVRAVHEQDQARPRLAKGGR